jgi:hypothetical protein
MYKSLANPAQNPAAGGETRNPSRISAMTDRCADPSRPSMAVPSELLTRTGCVIIPVDLTMMTIMTIVFRF